MLPNNLTKLLDNMDEYINILTNFPDLIQRDQDSIIDYLGYKVVSFDKILNYININDKFLKYIFETKQYTTIYKSLKMINFELNFYIKNSDQNIIIRSILGYPDSIQCITKLLRNNIMTVGEVKYYVNKNYCDLDLTPDQNAKFIEEFEETVNIKNLYRLKIK